MIKELLVVSLLSVLGFTQAVPVTTFDQRQEGDLNVKVDLDNFVILVARPVSAFDVISSMSSLLADARRIPESEGKSAIREDEEVKLDKSKDLEDVTLDEKPLIVEQPKEEEKVLVLIQEDEKKAGRNLEDIVRTLRNLKGKEAAFEKDRSKGLGSKYKFVESVEEPQSLKLIGDAIENCGPGRSRDRLGICQGDGLAQE